MSEGEPRINLNVNEDTVEARRDNTTLYTFLGALALYNHIFVVTDEESQTSPGFYIFADQPVFQEMAKYMFDTDYPMHLNMQEVAECDLNAYDRHVEQMCQDVESGVPEDWND